MTSDGCHSVQSHLFSHIRVVEDAKNLVCATLDWETVLNTDVCKKFHLMFCTFVDHKTKELLDSDTVHPFSLSAKLDSDDCPSFREIL